MQPDNIRPAARIPSLTFSDAIVHFQSRKLCVRSTNSRRKRHDSTNCIIAETRRYSQHLDACFALRDAGCGFFAARSCGFQLIFWANKQRSPNRGHAAAIRLPQIRIGGWLMRRS
jgi:hypothetical protein